MPSAEAWQVGVTAIAAAGVCGSAQLPLEAVALLAMAIGTLAAAAYREARASHTGDSSTSSAESDGLVLGALIWPVVFAAQLTTFPSLANEVRNLFWLSAVCGVSASFAEGKSRASGWTTRAMSWLCSALVLTLWLCTASSAVSVGRVVAWLCTVVVFDAVRQYLAHPPLGTSFSRGERTAVATALALLFVNTAFVVLYTGARRILLEWAPVTAALHASSVPAPLAALPDWFCSVLVPVLRSALPVPSRAPLLVVSGLVACAVFVFGVALSEPLRLVRRANRVAHKLRAALTTSSSASSSAASAIAAAAKDKDVSGSSSNARRARATPGPHVAVAAEVVPSDADGSFFRLLSGRADVRQVYVRAALVIGLGIAPVMALTIGEEPFRWLWKFLHSSRLSNKMSAHMFSMTFFAHVSAAFHDGTGTAAAVVANVADSSVGRALDAAYRLAYGVVSATPVRVLFCAYFGAVLIVGVAWCAPAGHPPTRNRRRGNSNADATTTSTAQEQQYHGAAGEDTDDTDTEAESDATAVQPKVVVAAARSRSRSGSGSTGSSTSSRVTSTTATAVSASAIAPVRPRSPLQAVRELPSLRAVVTAVPTILLRKYYHGIAWLLFVPAVIAEPAFACLALCGAFTIFLVCEYIRISTLPPLARPIRAFMSRYLDERDSGVLVLTHMYLLIGCALPVWLHTAVYLHSPAAAAAATATAAGVVGWRVWFPAADSLFSAPWLPALTGILALGVADTCASLFGYMFGSRLWPVPYGSRKTLVGTASAIAGVFVATALLTVASAPHDAVWSPLSAQFGGWQHLLMSLTRADVGFVVATVSACLFEAFTTQIDNLFLPLFYYAALALCTPSAAAAAAAGLGVAL